MRAALIFGAIGLLTACASRPPYLRGTFQDHEPGPTRPITPLNQQVTAEVGEPIWKSGTIQSQTVTTVRLEAPGRATLDAGHRLSVPSGTVAPLQRRSFNGQRAACFRTGGIGSAALHITGGGNAAGCLIDQTGSGVFDVAMFAMYEKQFKLDAPVPYTVVDSFERQVELPRAGRYLLLYQGTGGGFLKLSYREFSSDDYARPSFTQDLSYTLNPAGPTEVGFKGLRMRVQSANNKGITAVIEQPMQE